MAVIYGTQNVDEKYSSAIEPNLFSDTVLLPGVTFTNKYQEGPAGGIYVHKLDSGVAVTPGAPGRDFTDEDAKDSLIPIILNNNFQKSRKIYGVQANSVAFAMGEEYLADALAMVREGRQESAIACLVEEGTPSASTATDPVELLTEMRKEIKDNKGKANFALVSTDIYAKLLKVVGIQSYADPAVTSGELMKRFGLTIIECNAFGNDSATYIDSTGATKTVDLSGTSIVVGYNEAFSVIDNVDMYRLIDSENFNGVKAQVEVNTGFKVNSPAQIVVK